MKYITTLILTAFASSLLSEELSSMSQDEIDEVQSYFSHINIPSLVGFSKVAGVGEFVNIPSPTNRFLDVSVQQWWTSNPGTNDMLRIHNIYGNYSDWFFPTNVPVVFFATAASNVVISSCIGNSLVENMAQEERELLMFKHEDRSWFRVSRDNGLLYSFSTNLWQHMRISPNLTNRYEVLRDAYIAAYSNVLSEQPLESWRVAYDSVEGLFNIAYNAPENFLAEIMIDPLLPESMQGFIGARLEERFCWDFDTNGVFRAPDTAALDFASSNFTAQALAVWRTHDTNSVITFAQDAVAANATPEALLFRSATAYYLENDIATATNLIVAADLIVRASPVHTPKQKDKFYQVRSFLRSFGSYPNYVEALGRSIHLEGEYMEVFAEEHASDGNIFEKFGGEFPFSYTLKYMYNRE